MIKLLIVDDEQEVREGIKESIDWEANGIDVVGEAASGTEALFIINSTFPDIALIDIRMPEMNGLQLMEAIAATHPYIKPIILSGSEDFEYARRGLKLGALDYLLKPCRPKEILDAVLSAKQLLMEENANRDIILRYKENFLPLLKEKYLNTLISSSNLDESLLKKVEYVDFQFILDNILVAVIRCGQTPGLALELKASENLEDTLAAFVRESLQPKYHCECLISGGDIVILANVKADAAAYMNGSFNASTDWTEILAEDPSMKYLGELQAVLQQKLDAPVSIGISNPVSNLAELHNAYGQALQAVDFTFFFGDSPIVLFCQIKNQYNNNKAYPLEMEKQLLNCIKAGEDATAATKVRLFFEALAAAENNKSFILKSYYSLLFSLYQLCLESNIPVENIVKQLNSSDNQYSTIAKLSDTAIGLIQATARSFKGTKVNNKVIDNTLKFINENYSSNISLDTVAKNSFITPSYLSLLFKQVLGINFVDYLHKIRLNKACELLRDPKLRSYEIAYMVGYNDDKYFIQIFKKHLGLTPSQYRDTLL